MTVKALVEWMVEMKKLHPGQDLREYEVRIMKNDILIQSPNLHPSINNFTGEIILHA